MTLAGGDAGIAAGRCGNGLPRNLALIVPNAVALLIGASTIAVALRLGHRTGRGR